MDAVQQTLSNLACCPSSCSTAPTVPTSCCSNGISAAQSTQGCPCRSIPSPCAWSSTSFSPSWVRRGWGDAAWCLSAEQKQGLHRNSRCFPQTFV